MERIRPHNRPQRRCLRRLPADSQESRLRARKTVDNHYAANLLQIDLRENRRFADGLVSVQVRRCDLHRDALYGGNVVGTVGRTC
jgi:hypothetical protein